MFILLTLPSFRAVQSSSWVADKSLHYKGWWFAVGLSYSLSQPELGSQAGKASHHTAQAQLRPSNTASSVGKRDFPLKNINQHILHTKGTQQGMCLNPKRLPRHCNNWQYYCSGVTEACMSEMQKAKYYYVGNPLLNVYVVQFLVISSTQKKVKITRQRCNPFRLYQEYIESRRTWLKLNYIKCNKGTWLKISQRQQNIQTYSSPSFFFFFSSPSPSSIKKWLNC